MNDLEEIEKMVDGYYRVDCKLPNDFVEKVVNKRTLVERVSDVISAARDYKKHVKYLQEKYKNAILPPQTHYNYLTDPDEGDIK